MPSIQERINIEKNMNRHWQNLLRKEAVVDNKWAAGSNVGMRRQEHLFLKQKAKRKQDAKLYNTLLKIMSTEKMSKTTELIVKSGPDVAEQLYNHREWQRNFEKNELNKQVDERNLILYSAIEKAKPSVPTNEGANKEYKQRKYVLDMAKQSRVEPHELHIIRKLSPARPHSANSYARNTIERSHSQNQFYNKQTHLAKSNSEKTFTSLPAKMPDKFRQNIRPKSARAAPSRPAFDQSTNSHPSSPFSKASIAKTYQQLSRRVADTLTPKDIDDYVRNRPTNKGRDSYKKFQFDVLDDSRDFQKIAETAPDNTANHKEIMREASSSGTLGNEQLMYYPSHFPSYLYTRNGKGDISNQRAANTFTDTRDSGPSSSSSAITPRDDTISDIQIPQNFSRRSLFTETELQASICAAKGVDVNSSPLPVFAIRMYDVGVSCDFSVLASPTKTNVVAVPPMSPIAQSGRLLHPASGNKDVRTPKSQSRPMMLPTSSGILIECRLLPETEHTKSYEVFVSISELKALVKRTFSSSSNLWKAFDELKCVFVEKLFFDCLTDHLNESMQDQLCRVLAKKLDLAVTLDPLQSDGMQVDFKCKL